jgi:spore maturation protein CgeB
VVTPGPAFSVADVCNGYTKALKRAGWDVQTFDVEAALAFYEAGLRATNQSDEADPTKSARLMNQALRGVVYDWWPDLVLIVSSFFIAPETYKVLRQRPQRVAVIFTESPYEDDGQAPIAYYADVCAINDPINIDRFRGANPRTIYLPHAYDPEVHYPGPAAEQYRSQFCFVGTAFPSRIEWFEKAYAAGAFDGVDTALAGNWQELDEASDLNGFLTQNKQWCTANYETAMLYRGADASVNIYRTEAMRPELEHGWAMGPREVELAACGTFFLTQDRGENTDVLPMVPRFESPEDFAEKLRWWLDHDAERERVADAARLAVADRTFDVNLSRLLRLAGF